MKTPDKSAAQQRADRIRAFNQELAELGREQVLDLSAEQRAAIEHYHQGLFDQFRSAFDIDGTEQEKQLSLGMRIASFLGAVALAASVFFLFYQFWGRKNSQNGAKPRGRNCTVNDTATAVCSR